MTGARLALLSPLDRLDELSPVRPTPPLPLMVVPLEAVVGAEPLFDREDDELSSFFKAGGECFRVGLPPCTEGGGASGESYESTVMCVWAGLRGAPSGPVNRTFFFSPPFPPPPLPGGHPLPSESPPGGTVGRAKCRSISSSSVNPGVATVDQAPLAVLPFRPRGRSSPEVSRPGRFGRG